jgi:regulator of sigma E protease
MFDILIFLGALGVLVTVHEWGHFIVAKKAGVRVDIFSIGFGPKILGFSFGGTDYRIAPIPLGGYIRIYGHDPLEEAGGDPIKAAEIAADPQSFHSKSLWKRLAIVFAGPAMNLVLCFLIMPFVFMMGRLQPKVYDEVPVLVDVEVDSPAAKAGLKPGDVIQSFGGKSVSTWQDLLMQIALHPNETMSMSVMRAGQPTTVTAKIIQNPGVRQAAGYLGIEPLAFIGNDPIIDTVNPGTPAEKAGFRSGDKVVSIDGDPIRYWTELTMRVQKSAGRQLKMTVLRDGATVDLSAQPNYQEEHKAWLLGVTKKMDANSVVRKSYGIGEAIVLGAKENGKLFDMTIDILGRLFTGNLSFKALGGPIQIAQATSVAAKSGFGDFLYLLSFLSMQLGIMNLLPIPVLDGGHIVFMLIEAVCRKPVPPKIRQVSMQLGLFMLLSLMVVVTFNDVDNMWGFANIWQGLRDIF